MADALLGAVGDLLVNRSKTDEAFDSVRVVRKDAGSEVRQSGVCLLGQSSTPPGPLLVVGLLRPHPKEEALLIEYLEKASSTQHLSGRIEVCDTTIPGFDTVRGSP